MTDASLERKEVCAAFAGQVDQPAVQRIFQGLGAAMNNNIAHVHMLFQSSGGYIGDGICLYNFFKTLPIDLTLYNVGNVCSAGVTAYLGAKERKASAHAAFMVHRTQSPGQPASAERLHAITQSVLLDDERTEAILRQHVTLPDDKWAVHKIADLWLSADEAVKAHLATGIGEFSPPPGQQVYVIG